jgi:hypothetical protein
MRSKTWSHPGTVLGELVQKCTLLQLPTYPVRVQEFKFGVGEDSIARMYPGARQHKLGRHLSFQSHITKVVYTRLQCNTCAERRRI